MRLTHQRAARHAIAIHKGDNVKVLAGKDAGKNGRVLSIDAKKNRVVVEHVAIVKRHTRPNPQKNIKGGIVEKEASINVSNVMVICGNCGKATRVGHKLLPDPKKPGKMRSFRSCQQCAELLDK